MFSDTIIQIRFSRHLSRKDFANLLLVSHQTIRNWETGRTTPKASTVLRISMLLHVEPILLLNGNSASLSDEHLEYLYKKYHDLNADNMELFYNYISVLHELENGLNDGVMDFQEKA